MAKPFSVASSHSTIDLDSTPHRHTHPQDQPYKRRRRRKALPAPTRSLAPSATLLSLLSAIASSSVAEGSPAPPPFLCPSIQPSVAPTRRRVKRDAKSSTSTSVPSAPRAAVVRNIADKYEQGEDGLWRRVESYTLYGVCPACSTSAVSAIDEQTGRNPNITTSNNSTTTNTTMDTNYDSIPDKLPPGWQPKEAMWGHEGRTTLILAMSLVLAFFICFLIIACLFWRKSIRRRYKEGKDEEMRGKGRRRNREVEGEESREAMVERENKAKQKLWARATARWRANARISARQRRKRSSQMSQARRSSISLDSPREGLTSGRSSPEPSESPPPSRSVSRRPSSSSLRQESPAESSAAQQQQDTSTIVPTISLSPPPPPSSPPAYQQKALQAQPSSEGLFPSDDRASTSHLICSRRPSHSSFLSASVYDSGEAPSIPSAHVATDDKAVLARLADLASAPPSEDEGPSPQPQVSAPEWRDEEMEEFMAREACGESDGSTSQTTSTPSPFPPPPSKGSLFSPKFYDYPYAFEEMEIENLEPELGPSAPPFEETPSAPLVVDEHDMGLIPSAPPLLDDDDFYVHDSPIPSAPSHEPSPSHSSTEVSDGDGTAGQGGIGDGATLMSSGNVVGPVLPDYHP